MDGNRSYSLQSQLDDIAQRHPEFAEHLNFGGNLPPRTARTHSGSASSNYPEFRRRPFGSRLEGFGFPLDRYFEQDPEDFFRQTAQPHQEPPTATTKEAAEKEVIPEPKQQQTQATQTEKIEKPIRKNIQQSNTVDLGQKQEPVLDERTQRSMSAPPENHPPR